MSGQNFPESFSGIGSALLYADNVPLGNGETRDAGPLRTHVSTLGIDISADRDCTVTIIRCPDGVTAGAQSVVAQITAGQPAFLQYSQLLCQAVKVRVVNLGGSAMTSFAMYVRGGA